MPHHPAGICCEYIYIEGILMCTCGESEGAYGQDSPGPRQLAHCTRVGNMLLLTL